VAGVLTARYLAWSISLAQNQTGIPVMAKRIIFGLVSGLGALASLYAGYAVVYFHWDASNPHTAEELQTARWGYHIWAYILGFCLLFFVLGLFLFVRSLKASKDLKHHESNVA
jgi:RsiW-degrading membrane proteinase PrsW (M82 family)